jgi:flagellar biosynthesis/type III secretory pathway protein FliH
VDERFISLAAFVRGPAPAAGPVAPAVVRGVIDFAHADLATELSLMRLAALEAFERSTAQALRLFASDVLARELALSPADIEALVKRALASFAEHEPVAISVSPSDAERVRAQVPVRIDPALEAGDLVVQVRDGTLESQFSFRLEDALRRAASI